jgi:hypothetical protein
VQKYIAEAVVRRDSTFHQAENGINAADIALYIHIFYLANLVLFT